MAVEWLAGASFALAQVRPPAQETASGLRPLTPREGETIVNAAWEWEQQAGRKPDCSLLVDKVYTLAGYSYPCANSFDLYSGRENFVRAPNWKARGLARFYHSLCDGDAPESRPCGGTSGARVQRACGSHPRAGRRGLPGNPFKRFAAENEELWVRNYSCARSRIALNSPGDRDSFRHPR